MEDSMSDKEPDNAAPQQGRLSQHYKPAESNSVLVLEFNGNTAAPYDIQFINVDPFQMLAAASYLEMKAKQMIAQQEAEIARQLMEQEKAKEIQIAGRVPDSAELFEHLKQ